jgi:hypothetical protein
VLLGIGGEKVAEGGAADFAEGGEGGEEEGWEGE